MVNFSGSCETPLSIICAWKKEANIKHAGNDFKPRFAYFERPHNHLTKIFLNLDKLPLSLYIADNEKYRPHKPVNGHRHPDSKNSHFKVLTQNIAEPYAENPHGKNGDDHTVPRVVGGPQCIAQCKRRRPDCDGADAVVKNDFGSQTGGFGGKAVYV